MPFVSKHGYGDLLMFKLNIIIRNKKEFISAVQHVAVVGFRQVGLSVSGTADLLGFSTQRVAQRKIIR